MIKINVSIPSFFSVSVFDDPTNWIGFTTLSLAWVYFLFLYTDSDAPPRVISWPFLGSALEIGSDCRTFLGKYFRKFNSPIFTAHIAGRTIHFVDSSYHAHLTPEALFRNKELKSRPVVDAALQSAFGLNSNLTTIASSNALVQSLHRYTLNGGLPTMVEDLQRALAVALPDIVGQQYVGGLNDVLWRVLWRASATALGAVGMAKNDHLVNDLRAFDRVIPLLIAGRMSLNFFPIAKRSKEHLIAAMADWKFLQSQKGILRDRFDSAKRQGVKNVADFSRLQLVILWAANGNTVPAAFWVLFHILSDPESHKAVQKEVDHLFGDGDKELSCEVLDTMVVLNSCIQETLRIYSENMVIREVQEDFELDLGVEGLPKYNVFRGSRVAVMMSRLHMDGTIFENPTLFRWNRFLDPEKKLSKNGIPLPIPLLRPFGAGSSVCPGRKFAVYELKVLLVRLLHNYELELIDKQPPALDHSRIGLGMYVPKTDVQVRVTSRS
jgi:cholesterol 7alpha-monooxygenase